MEQTAAAQRVPFGALLRRYRVAAGLSQEALAERARLSVRGISDLERGLSRTPRRETVALLAEALGLTIEAQAVLQATIVRRRGPPATARPLSGPSLPATVAAATPATQDLPAGTLTFLLTDIEGSSGLWERHPQAMSAALARHETLVASAVERHGGRLLKRRGEGDSTLSVFARASAALAAACTLQQAFQAEPWPPQTPLRVRMALHSGEAELRAGDFTGRP
jgi:class 3 adenylate cyclase/DNA-binding XRE family transcriptional regulator